MKKMIAVLLCVLTIGAMAMTSCAEQTDSGNVQTTVSETSEGTEMTKYEYALQFYQALPELDYGGQDFTILARAAVGNSEKEVWVEEMDGDVINDAVYTRNLAVNERFNFNIVLKTGDVPSVTKQSILSGDDTYKIVYPGIFEAASMAQQGYLLNYLDYENLHIYEQWWDKGTAELEIAGKVYFMNGDINILDNDVTYILMFNKQIIADMGLSEPYQLVRDGKWVIDTFSSMIRDVTTDLNGDGKFTDDDMFGYVATNAGPNTFFYASDLKYVKLDSDGLPYLDVNTQKITDLLAKVVDIFTGGNTTRVPGDVAVGKKIFMEDRALFYGEVVSYIINLRGMETDFGILPLPKYDEAQQYYYTYSEGNGSAVGIPMISAEPGDVAAVLEAMAIQSFVHLTPAYYDTALQRKYTRDNESSEMLDIALAYRVYDIGRLYTSLNLGNIFSNLALKGSMDFASSYAKAERTATKNLDKIVSAFEEQG